MKTIRSQRKSKSIHGVILVTVGLVSLAWLQLSFAQLKPEWQQRWEEVLSRAKKEGKVVVLGSPGELIRDALTQGFRKAFPGIGIDYAAARGAELAAKLKAERDGGIYSTDVVVSGTTTAISYFKPMAALAPIKPALILPQVTDLKKWRNNTLEFSDKAGSYNLVFSDNVLPPVFYDPKQVKPEEIAGLHDLLHPKWAGKIVINDPLPSGPGNVSFRWIWRLLGPEKATDYYRKIRAQAAAVDRDQRRQIEWVAQGKYAILFSPSSAVGEQLLQRGLRFGVLSEFADYGGYITAGFGSLMLIDKAPHPNAATVYINWLLSLDGQTAWSKAINAASHRLDVPTDHVSPYLVPKAGARFWLSRYKPGDRYWISHHEDNVERTSEEERILKELFGR
ncbi:MAG: ABC transporter substrate-binding protein [Candidatus Binatia bacterium]